ncbi:unannotated protein [freshwater metagenome]|uniref:Unannotated protein n=1 Tax=freshwater metagenome TaxID=449393 RepID=A0A6J6PMT6_9ZZZZ
MAIIKIYGTPTIFLCTKLGSEAGYLSIVNVLTSRYWKPNKIVMVPKVIMKPFSWVRTTSAPFMAPIMVAEARPTNNASQTGTL